MDTLLQFFSDLILFTAGLAVVVLWLIVLVAIAIEVYDQFTEKEDDNVQDDLL